MKKRSDSMPLSVVALAAVLSLSPTGMANSAEPATKTPMPSTTQTAADTFTNPILRSRDGGDPWVVLHEGTYYFTATLERDSLWIWKAKRLTDLDDSERVKVWQAPPSGPMSRQIWAPEMHRFGDRWYLYFTASDGVDRNHRHYVLESAGADPLGPYTMKGRVDTLDHYAIDGSILKSPDGKAYWMYTTGRLEIAPMVTPWQADTDRRVVLAEATEVWERTWVEAPQALVRDGKVFVVYSAGHSGTPHYVLGLLEHKGGEILNSENWVKHPKPVFVPHVSVEGSVFTVGHNGFTTSPDGKEDWIVYHAKDWRGLENEGFSGRTVRAQKFTWDAESRPVFGLPVPSGIPLPLPSGESPAPKTVTPVVQPNPDAPHGP